jgi:RNA polymerase-binding transcription factor DksA
MSPAERLTQLRADLLEQVAALTAQFDEIVAASAGSNADDEHDPEGATIGFERAQVAALLEAARGRLVEVEAAERRIAGGEYGACTACGRAIEAPRLEARPTALTCVACTPRRSPSRP